MRKRFFKCLWASFSFTLCWNHCFCWGFFAHQKINYYAVFLLPPEMVVLYKPNIMFLSQHATDPDKRRYLLNAEGARHFIDLNLYGQYPYDSLPRKWDKAVIRFTRDSLNKHGIVPWWILTVQKKLTEAFKQKNKTLILKLSAEIGHYIADAHVPLHTNSNHNGQKTNQEGIHAFWESRIPELLADREWKFFLGKASYLGDPSAFIWQRVLESAAAADTVLKYEKQLSARFPPDRKFAFENRNGKLVKQYASDYSIAYDESLNGMVQRRMRQSVYAVACFWYTAWVDAGQPDLANLVNTNFSPEEKNEFEALEKAWRNNGEEN